MGFLVLGGRIVPLFADRAFQCNDVSHATRWVYALSMTKGFIR
jgi:hypothetical protein